MFQAIGDWFSNLFGGGKKKKEEQPAAAPRPQPVQRQQVQQGGRWQATGRGQQPSAALQDRRHALAVSRSIGTPAPITQNPADQLAQRQIQDTQADEQFRQNLTAKAMANRGNRTDQQIHESVDRAVQANRQARAAQRTAQASQRTAEAVGQVTAPLRAVREKVYKPVERALESYEKAIDSTDNEAGHQWTSPGDYLRFIAKLPSGMGRGIVGGGEKLGTAITGHKINDDNSTTKINGLQRAGYLVDGALDTAGVALGGSGKLLQAVTKQGVKQAAHQGKHQIVKTITKDALKEGTEELVQHGAGDLADDGKINNDLRSYRDAFLLGGLGGTVMSGAGQGVSAFRNRGAAAALKQAVSQQADQDTSVASSANANMSPIGTRTAAEVQHNIDNGIITPDTKHLSPEQRAATAINARARVEEQQAQQVQEQSRPTTEVQVADKLRISDERAAEIQAYNNHIGQLRQQESKLLAQGLSENSAPVINNRRAQAEAIYARDHIGEVDENGLRYRMRDGQRDAATQQAIIERSRQVLGDDSVLFETLGTRNGHNIDGFYREADDIIRIAKGRADMDTMNHEMVHRVMASIDRQLHERAIQYIIQRDGAENLVREYRARGYDVALTDEGIRLAAEEKLADGFMQYAKLRANGISVEILGQKLTLPRHIITYFERVWERIKSFAGKADRAKQLYAQMETGKFRGQAGVSRRLEDSFAYKLNSKMALDAVRKFKQLLNAPRNVYAVFGKVSDKTKGIVEQLSGESLQADAQIIIESSYARHLNKHTRDVVSPLTDADIANISEVVNNPDSYAVGEFKRGKQRVVLEKQMDNAHVAVVEVIKEGNALNVVTFYNRSFRVNDTANGSSRGDIRNVTDSPNEPIIANPPRIVNDKRFKLDETLQGFAHSSNHTPVATIGDAEVVLGDYGRNAMQRKADKIDRFDAAELPETLRHITGVYRSGDSSFRKDNIALVATMPDGEKRAVYTRLNADGQEEIINWHKITIPGYEDGLQSYGTPAWNRTRNFGLEHLAGNPPHRSVEGEKLAASESSLHDDSSIAKTDENVNIDTPKVGETPHLTEHAQDVRDFYFEEYKDKGADAMRRDLIEQIWNDNKKGQGVDFIQTPGEYYGGKRVSNNNPFYAGFYEEYGRKPTKQEITAIVDDALGVDNELGRVSLPRAAEDYLIGNYFGDIDGLRTAYSQVDAHANTPAVRPAANKLDNAARQEASEALQQEYETHLDHQWAARLDEKHKQEILKQRKRIAKEAALNEVLERALDDGPRHTIADIIKNASLATKMNERAVAQHLAQVAERKKYDLSGERPFPIADKRASSMVDSNGQLVDIENIMPDIKEKIKLPGVEHAVPAQTGTANTEAHHIRQMVYKDEDGSYRTFFEYRTPSGEWQKTGADAAQLKSPLQNRVIGKIASDKQVNEEAKRAYDEGISIQYIWRENSRGYNAELVSEFDSFMETGNNKKYRPSHKLTTYNPSDHYIENGLVVDAKTGQILGNYMEMLPDGSVTMYAGRKKISLHMKDIDFSAIKEMKYGAGQTWTTEGVIDRITGALRGSNSIKYFTSFRNKTKEALMHIMSELPRKMMANMVREGNAVGSEIKSYQKRLTKAAGLRGRSKRKMLQEAVFVIEPARPARGEKSPSYETRLEAFREVYGEAVAKALDDYNSFLRAVYKNLLTRQNEIRVALGKEPILERKDYITHIGELQSNKGTIAAMFGSAKNLVAGGEISPQQRSSLPAKLAGQTGNFKPNQKFNQFALARVGDVKPLDPFTPLAEYTKIALHNIHMTDAITMNRSLEVAVRAASEARQEFVQSGVRGMMSLLDRVDRLSDSIKRGDINAEEISTLRNKIWGLSRAIGGQVDGLKQFSRLANQISRQGVDSLTTDDVEVLKNATEQLANGINKTIDDTEFMQQLTANADGLTQFVGFVQEHTNRLAGKSDPYERVGNDTEPSGGRKFGRAVARGMMQQAALSKIVGNLSSVIAQTASLPALTATTSPKALFAAFGRKNRKAILQKSDALAIRYADDALTQDGAFEKMMKVGGFPMGFVESTVIEYTFLAKYHQGIQNGLSDADAVKFAERFINDTVTLRDQVSAPRAYNRLWSAAFLQFTREVTQQNRYMWNQMSGKQKVAFFVNVTIMYNILQLITGNKPGADPIGALIEIIGDWMDDGTDDEEKDASVQAKLIRTLQRVASETVAATPLAAAGVNALTSKDVRKTLFGKESPLGRYDGTLAAASIPASVAYALNDVGKAIKASKEGDDEKAEARSKAALQSLVKELPMGSQARKTWQGLDTVASGEVRDNNGAAKAEVNKDNLLNWVQGVLFGKNALWASQLENKSGSPLLHWAKSGGIIANAASQPQPTVVNNGQLLGIDALDTKDRLSLKKSIKKGSTIIDNGVLKTKSGEVKRDIHRQMAEKQGQSDEAYTNYLIGYGLDEKSDQQQQASTGDPTLDSLLNTARMGERSKRKAAITKAVAMFSDKKKFASLPDWVKGRFYKEHGFSKFDVAYSAYAGLDAESKIDGLYRPLAQQGDRKALLDRLWKDRRAGLDGRKMMADDKVISALQQEGFITKAEARTLRQAKHIKDADGKYQTKLKSSARGNGGGRMSRAVATGATARFMGNSQRSQYASAPRMALSALPLLNASGVSRRGRSIHATIASVKQSTKKRRLA